MPLRLFAPRYWPTWAGLALLRLLALLPFPLLLASGRGLGALLRHLPIGFVRTARRNLELCFPHLDAPARQRLLEQHFSSLGMALMEIPLAWWLTPAREHLHAALAAGHGAILLTAHFTSMEMAGRALVTVAPAGFLYRPTKNEVIALALKHFRTPVRCKGHPQG